MSGRTASGLCPRDGAANLGERGAIRPPSPAHRWHRCPGRKLLAPTRTALASSPRAPVTTPRAIPPRAARTRPPRARRGGAAGHLDLIKRMRDDHLSSESGADLLPRAGLGGFEKRFSKSMTTRVTALSPAGQLHTEKRRHQQNPV